METEDGGLPETSRSEIIEALDDFDEKHRGNGRWANWQSNRNHKYAIEHRGRRYPVKQIVSMATGRPNQTFHGRDQANSYVENYGFDVVNLRDNSLSGALEEILDTYLDTRRSTDHIDSSLHIWDLFEQIESRLEESSVLSRRPHVGVNWSVGQGRWTHVPWIALLDDRETSTTRMGTYVVFLFREDMSGVYLTYSQGITRPTKLYGQKVGQALVQTRAERIRHRSKELEEADFTLDTDINLATETDRGQSYEKSTIAYKLYSEGEIPSDEELLSDVDSLLQTYDRYLSQREEELNLQIDRGRLRTAVENVIRPAVLQRSDLEEEGRHGHLHHQLLPEGTPRLTPSAISENPKESVLRALEADTGLLSSSRQRNLAKEVVREMTPEKVREEVSSLLYGEAPLADRALKFMGLGGQRTDGASQTQEIDVDVVSYLLALSDPQEYALCTTGSSGAYKSAAEALLQEDPVGPWDERIAHARAFYKEALSILQEDHGDLPFFDLMHVHIAFFLAENEDEDAPWGEGAVEFEDESETSVAGREQKAYKVAPGEGGKHWEDCREEGYICVGWGEVGSLDQYDSKEAFRDAFRETFYPETYDTEQKITQKSSEVWTLTELKPGDLVIANRGISEILAVGEVVEPGYEWRPDREDLRHTVHVDWDETYAQEIPPEEYWRFVTVQELSDDLLDHILKRRGTAVEGQTASSYEPPPFEKIYTSVREKGMVIDQRTLRRYHVSLRTRGFVILSGVSGTGKTWLTKLYADAVNAKRLLQPVAPNWTTDEDLLGYYNPVEGEYHHTEVSRFLKEAQKAYEDAQAGTRRPPPYHLVLDEMNLARVEYYFATLLSKMEQRKREGTATLSLGPETEVLLPPNFSFIGTVNIDETTHSFADKVYDRAQLIEMKAPEEQLREHLGEEPYASILMDVFGAIGGVAPFAFRVLDEIAKYVSVARDHGSSWEEALDEQLLQKVLPKVKGTEPEVGEALSEFLEVVPEESYPLSHAKAQSMLESFRTHGFTSYF